MMSFDDAETLVRAVLPDADRGARLTDLLAEYLDLLIAEALEQSRADDDGELCIALSVLLDECEVVPALARAAAAVEDFTDASDTPDPEYLWEAVARPAAVGFEAAGDSRRQVEALRRYAGSLRPEDRAVQLTHAVDVCREQVAEGRDEFRPLLAETLPELIDATARLAEPGSRPNELWTELLTLHEGMAALDRPAQLPGLASALADAAEFYDSRDPAAALAHSTRAVELAAELGSPWLLAYLKGHVKRLGDAGDTEAAAAHCRMHLEHSATDYDFEVTARMFLDLGRPDDAVEASARMVAEVPSPGGTESDWAQLAAALLTHADILHTCGRTDSARQAWNEYLAVWARVRELWPERRDLAVAEAAGLASDRMLAIGDVDGAADMAARACEVWESLLDHDHERNLRSLATALRTQAEREERAGRTGESADTTARLSARWEELAVINPGRFRPMLVDALIYATEQHLKAGRPVSADAHARRAQAVGEALATAEPDRFAGRWTAALHNRAAALDAVIAAGTETAGEETEREAVLQALRQTEG